MNAEGITIGASAVVAVSLVVVVARLVMIFRRSESHLIRMTAIAAAIMCVVLSPLVVDQLVTSLNRTRGAAYVMVDPGWAVKFAPAIVAVIVAMVIIARGRGRNHAVR